MGQLAGIELGGTKTVLVRGTPGAISERVDLATTSPQETLDRAGEVLRGWNEDNPIAALGIGSFGPVRIDPQAADYGRILATPKPGWEGADLIGAMRAALGCRIALDTDVNAALLAEHVLGAAHGCPDAIYITIGTGVGGGILAGGKPVHGALHPEIGHVRLRRDPGDGFAGCCPFHGDCAEGLLSGPALAARFGRHPADVPQSDPGWSHVAHDLAELLAMLLLTLSPQRIVLGGGVVNRQPQLLTAAIRRVTGLVAGYLEATDADALSCRIVKADLQYDAGPQGTLILAWRLIAASI